MEAEAQGMETYPAWMEASARAHVYVRIVPQESFTNLIRSVLKQACPSPHPFPCLTKPVLARIDRMLTDKPDLFEMYGLDRDTLQDFCMQDVPWQLLRVIEDDRRFLNNEIHELPRMQCRFDLWHAFEFFVLEPLKKNSEDVSMLKSPTLLPSDNYWDISA